MRPALTLATLSLVAFNSLAQTAATPNVEVTFDKPEHFRDASLDSNGYQRGADAYVMKELSAYLVKLGQRYLPAGQTLRIDIRDIDLAGHYEPWRSNAYSVRILRDVTWPSIDLHYTLSQPGQVLSQADAHLSDKFYLQRPGRRADTDRLYAEKAMLQEWFRKQFSVQQQTSGF
ncbi:hypothetical protein D3C76_777960 [compost metagenome]|jgi:hypothetical protein|uniref:DUF3016 domain-containing protein n=1 Tax=Pseudomonas wadenswilerensis TaxID=1785161 RepID=A0A380T0S4_9PSED|nr:MULTISPECIES: DUF3016 domain-containing protein [Pseudomonas]MCE5982986.1 DUF3016 domain-containing protein [Pseudomonas sp. LF19]SUQ63160.1 hypothetical protein CCOS864_02610 [Pseudomonas wadenswilerensis]